MKFNKGDVVQVKLAGLFVKGIIKSTKVNGDCIVVFESGSEQEISSRCIKLMESSKIETLAPKSDREKRSPARTPKSPTRRSPARNTSPARRTRASPSPSRKKSATVITSPVAPKPPVNQTRILKVSLENIENTIGDSIATVVNRRRKIRDVESASSISSINKSELLKTKDEDDEIASPTLIHDFTPEPESERVVYVQPTPTSTATATEQLIKVNNIGKFSDDEETIVNRKSETKTIVPDEHREFGGWFGAFILMILMPAIAITLHIFCNKDQCNYRKLPDFHDFQLLETYYNIKAFGVYCAYILLIAILSRIPFVGKRVNSQPSKENMYTYHMNGLFSAFIVLGLLVTLESFNKPVVNFIADKYFHLMISAITISIVLSILVFIRSKFVAVSQLNPYGVTYNIVYDFFMGRQINPRIFGFDLKTILLRASYISILILNSIYIFKSMNIVVIDPNDLYQWDNFRMDLEPTLLVASILQMLYVLDMLAFESNLTTTFELQHEGLGYMKLMQYAIYPFLMTSITKFLYEHNSKGAENPLILTTICLVYLAGYILYRGSNSQKNAFRLNPYDNSFEEMMTLQTGKGKKLLMSGFWGKLRHPNYLGDILIHLSMGVCAAGSPAALSTLPVAFLLTYRASRDGYRCKKRYSMAWERYSHKVKYAIIPKVY